MTLKPCPISAPIFAMDPMSAFRLSRPVLLTIAIALVHVPTAFAASCDVSAQGLAFGSYDPFMATPLNGVGTLTVICDISTTHTIALSAGTGSFVNRHLNGAGTALNYNLYTDATRTVVWGDGSGGSAVVSNKSASASHSVYGRTAALQNVPIGIYTDSIVVIFSY